MNWNECWLNSVRLFFTICGGMILVLIYPLACLALFSSSHIAFILLFFYLLFVSAIVAIFFVVSECCPSAIIYTLQINETREMRTFQTTQRRSETIRTELDPSVRISARMRMLLLPPLKSFRSRRGRGETTTASFNECAVCLEEFKNGELVQPFPRCGHEFHPSCINSWLRSGKTTCPTCRFCLEGMVLDRGINAC